jgi:hypothetical protein
MRRLGRVVPLVAALVGAVALMHSIPRGEEHGSSTVAAMNAGQASCCPAQMDALDQVRRGDMGGQPMPGHGPGGLAHLCLAVLTAVLAGVLGVGLGRRLHARRTGAVGRGRARERTLARPPPRAGRTLLTSVCVLRV